MLQFNLGISPCFSFTLVFQGWCLEEGLWLENETNQDVRRIDHFNRSSSCETHAGKRLPLAA